MGDSERARFEVPCIDLADDEDADVLAGRIDAALKEFGLLFVRNHGVDQRLIDRMWPIFAVYALIFRLSPKISQTGDSGVLTFLPQQGKPEGPSGSAARAAPPAARSGFPSGSGSRPQESRVRSTAVYH